MSRIQIPLGINSAIVERFLNTEGSFAMNKFGENPASAGNAWEDLWDGGGTYSFPATADITHLSQAVDQEAMRGKTVHVEGLDINWDLVSQDVTLDGTLTTTAVALTTPLTRHNRMHVHADVVTDQIINLKNVGGGTTYGIIQAGNNQTLQAVYSVPRNFTAYMTNFWYDAEQITAARACEFRLWTQDRKNLYAFALKHSRAVSKEVGSGQHFFNPYKRITEKTDIKLNAYPDTNAANTHGGFDILVIPNA